jgi:hypothetical protein
LRRWGQRQRFVVVREDREVFAIPEVAPFVIILFNVRA